MNVDRTKLDSWISPPRSRLGPLNVIKIKKHHLNKFKTSLELDLSKDKQATYFGLQRSNALFSHSKG